MFRITLALALLFLANTAQTVQTIAKAQEQRTQAELPTLTHCEALIKSVTPAIVQFSYDDSGSGRQSHFGCGVIVSNDGHVAVSGPVRAVLDDKLLELRLADGRRVIGYPIIKDQKPMILETQAIAPTQTLQSRDAWYDEFWIECDKETVGETRGASGGGIFDTSGNVIGVLLGGAGNEIQNARAELFHKNWADLTASNLIEVIDPKLRLDVSPALKKLMADLNNRDPQP